MLVKGDSCAKGHAGQAAGDAVGPILYSSAWREASRLRRANSAWARLMPGEAPRTKRFDRLAAPVRHREGGVFLACESPPCRDVSRVSRAFTR